MTRREAQSFEVVKRLKVPTTLSKQPTDNKALKEIVATSKNSTTQSGPTIHTAAHVGARTYISPTHTQQVMSPIDTAVGKNQSSGKNSGKPSDLFNNDVKPDPQKIISNLKKIQLISLISMIQFTYLVMTSNLIPQKKSAI